MRCLPFSSFNRTVLTFLQVCRSAEWPLMGFCVAADAQPCPALNCEKATLLSSTSCEHCLATQTRYLACTGEHEEPLLENKSCEISVLTLMK